MIILRFVISAHGKMRINDAVHRALKPGGRFLVHVPNGQVIFSGNIMYGDLTDQTAFTQISIRQLLRICGFDQISCYEASYY